MSALADDLVAKAVDYARRVQDSRVRGGDAPAWDELDPEIQEMKASQIAEIPAKLRVAGFEVVTLGSPESVEFSISRDVLEILARMEHERWCCVRRSQGWSFGSVRDDARRLHPGLVPYEALAEPEKQKDREQVLRIPAQLYALGYGVSHARSDR